MKTLHLSDVCWLTSEVHSLMTSLHLTHLDHLVVLPQCKLRSGLPSASPASRITVDQTQIQASLSINTLVALLSHIELDVLSFHEDCQVLDMSSYSPPSPQVSHNHQHICRNSNLKVNKRRKVNLEAELEILSDPDFPGVVIPGKIRAGQ